jgi:hypothetical protein
LKIGLTGSLNHPMIAANAPVEEYTHVTPELKSVLTELLSAQPQVTTEPSDFSAANQ